MKISYAIPVCNEVVEIKRLITFLLENKHDNDEIVVAYDSTNGDPQIMDYLTTVDVKWGQHEFNNDFSALKNDLNSVCEGDFIFQIDADEMITKEMIHFLPEILEKNNVDLILVPRINTVEGLTAEHLQNWGWEIDRMGRINYPDYQYRIYRNDKKINWVGEVHEQIKGYKNYALLPKEDKLSLYHPKTIDRQEKQNQYYATL